MALVHATAHGAVDLFLSGRPSKTDQGHAEDLIDDLLAHLG